MDKSAFFYAQKCGRCHPGGGSLEYDRNGNRYYENGKFGYELAGIEKPELDGDYTPFSAGNPEFGAPWDKSGVIEADCLLCHLKGYNWKARFGALNGRLFKWSATIAVGWADFELGKDKKGMPVIKEVTVNYARDTIVDAANLGERILKTPPDSNCWSCHKSSDTKKRGRSISPDTDVHSQGGVGCVVCHTNDDQHNFAKGDAGLSTVRDDLDYTMKDCHDCHLHKANERAPHPATHKIPPLHYALIGCEACHVPYKDTPAILVIDNATTGKSIGFPTARFLTYDEENPGKWQPALKMHNGRIKPFKPLASIWWGDLNDKSGIIAPIPLWKIRGMKNKPEVKDDTGDGKPEVNTAEEIKAFLIAISQAKDKFGNPLVKGVPGLAKGGKIYKMAGEKLTHYKDHQADPHGFSLTHNVLEAEKAIGVGGCTDCHSENSDFFYRRVLIDPYDEDGKPVYEPTWMLMGYNEDRVKVLTKPVTP